MKFGRLLSLAALAASALLFANTATSASTIAIPGPPGSVSLSSLVTNTGTVGDKSFTFISAVISGSPTPTITTAGIQVSALSVSGTNVVPPFGFQLSGGFSTGAGQTGDLALTFIVSSSGTPITAVNLTANPTLGGTVTENIFVNNNGSQGASLGSIVATSASPTGSFTLATPMASLYIIKDIQFNNGANISAITQTFTQAVPEPASVVMAGIGFLGTVGFALRRKVRVTA